VKKSLTSRNFRALMTRIVRAKGSGKNSFIGPEMNSGSSHSSWNGLEEDGGGGLDPRVVRDGAAFPGYLPVVVLADVDGPNRTRACGGAVSTRGGRRARRGIPRSAQPSIALLREPAIVTPRGEPHLSQPD